MTEVEDAGFVPGPVVTGVGVAGLLVGVVVTAAVVVTTGVDGFPVRAPEYDTGAVVTGGVAVFAYAVEPFTGDAVVVTGAVVLAFSFSCASRSFDSSARAPSRLSK